MQGIMRVQDLITQLEACDYNAPIYIAVIKQPSEVSLEHWMTGDWENSSHVEVTPLEVDELQFKDGGVYLAVELADLSEEQDRLMTK